MLCGEWSVYASHIRVVIQFAFYGSKVLKTYSLLSKRAKAKNFAVLPYGST